MTRTLHTMRPSHAPTSNVTIADGEGFAGSGDAELFLIRKYAYGYNRSHARLRRIRNMNNNAPVQRQCDIQHFTAETPSSLRLVV